MSISRESSMNGDGEETENMTPGGGKSSNKESVILAESTKNTMESLQEKAPRETLGEDDDDIGLDLLQTDENVKKIYRLLFKVINARERVQTKLAARRNPFFCMFCKIDLRKKGKFMAHYRSKEHKTTMATSLKSLANLIGRFHIALQDAAFKDSNQGKKISMCRLCLIPHGFDPTEHLQSAEHKLGVRLVKLRCRPCGKLLDNRIEMEKHLGSLTHVRNHFRNFKGLLLEEDTQLPMQEPDDEEPPGSHYIYDSSGFHCSVCHEDIKGSNNDFAIYDHCKTEAHFKNYKKYVEGEAIEKGQVDYGT